MGNGEADGEISGVAARGRSGAAARAGNADIFVRNFYRPRKKREWERRVFGGGYAGLLFKRSGKMRVGGGGKIRRMDV